MSNLKTIITEDGSSSIYNLHLKETYHSTHGALQESLHVFIHHGLRIFPDDRQNIKILEVGLGTGLNALLTLQELLISRKQKLFFYTALEPFPLPEEILQELNYSELLSSELAPFFKMLHGCNWRESLELTDQFFFKKVPETLQEFSPAEKYDLVYYDAFAPSKQPEMWELNCFEKLYDLMEKDGVLVSYCASGQFKRNLNKAGFMSEVLPGPPGKKEMTRAVKH